MTNLPLFGKKIIFFCPKYFGYEKEILLEMQNMGADVSFSSDRPSEHPWVKGFIRLFPKLGSYYSNFYFLKWLEKYGTEQCDLIFIIRGEGLSPFFIQTLRKRYPRARVVCHLWDSVSTIKEIKLKLSCFDDISSYDPKDCKQFKQFRFRPLFFLDKYLDREIKTNNLRLFFVGTLHSDRPKVISMIKRSLPKNIDFDYWLFSRSRVEYAFRMILDPFMRTLDRSRFIFKPMPFATISTQLKKCSAVIDIEHPNNSGLTMRTFEMIASGKKLITTNSFVMQHDFYDPKRICVIDRTNPSVLSLFLEAETPPLSDDFVSKYSLRSWILDILGSR